MDLDKNPAPAGFSRDEAIAAFRPAPDAQARDFMEQALDDFRPSDLPHLTAADFAAVAADIWRECESQSPGVLRMTLNQAMGADGKPLSLDLLCIVQTDISFLVDSVMAELVEQGLNVRAMLHPVIAGRAPADPRRSVIAVLFEPLDQARRAAVLDAVGATLADVRAAVADFPAMLALMGRTVAELEQSAPEGSERDEALALLHWLQEDRFVFLGARVYDYPLTPTGRYAHQEPRFDAGHSLGLLRDPSLGVLRRDNEPSVLSPRIKGLIESGPPLSVAKSNRVSHVHRRVYMDYIGVKRFGADGRPIGEVRFLGLFTAAAYDEPARVVPLIRRKVANVLARAARTEGSHDRRRLVTVLESYPRDELFQIDEDDLLRIALGVVHLYDRPRLGLFVRRDPFDRFVSVLVYVPKDRFTAALAQRAGEILARAWGGRISASYPAFSDAPLARILYVVGLTASPHAEPDLIELEAELAEAARSWPDRFEEALRLRGGVQVAALRRRYGAAFPVGYQDQFDVAEALADMDVIETLGPDRPMQARVFRAACDEPAGLRLKLYQLNAAALLSDILPIVESMGLKGLAEHGFEVTPEDAPSVWVHELFLRHASGLVIDLKAIRAPLEQAVVAVWSGRTENDGFNRLVLEMGASWREAALIRTLARYRRQSGLDPSRAVQESALADHPAAARLLLDLFRVRFDPAMSQSQAERQALADGIFAQILEALQAVASLDADRVLRRLALLIQACVRTNYYQAAPDGTPKPYISIKIASRLLDDLPAPKPFAEIFVWSPQVEGVHLRFGPIARGGLRWSDRRDDFRTEVLGLAKAQQVKNAVIVPVGAKGGFYPKQLPRTGAPEAVQQAAIEAYRTFLRGLLDLTDNLDADGQVVAPPGVVRHDGDDPYLVVAADKGTASFSDIANAMAAEYGFWLGDAFASGGSAGYDHKAMGITARGAWEAIKRHFRELGKDIQRERFSVIGVGDMSGDVFGNGMLLSKTIRLVAAFDHRHVFLDPDPDPAASWAERKRLFDLPRSSWGSYNPELISKGGGVYARTAKTVPISPEVAALLDIRDKALTPADLIRAVLKAKVDLLYLGGIGTYVKAARQSHLEVGDKANDAVRVDADELRCTVVGEGANLGVTQAGRIDFARAGGRINTDAIDNSAGVDTSDHEVNIKILTAAAERAGVLNSADRDGLLRSMTQDVAAHVLAHNHDQTLALSLLQGSAVPELDSHARFMAGLVAAGRLDLAVEGLPDHAAIAELAKAGQGLTRPELAVLLAYGKLELSAEILASPAPDDDFFAGALERYFPPALGRFHEQMQRHRLRREIIATSVANAMVDVCGPTFVSRVRAATGCDTAAVVTAFEAAWRVFRLDDLWRDITALDADAAKAQAQLVLYEAAFTALRGQTYWLARRVVKGQSGVRGLIEAYQPAADALRAEGLALLSPLERSDAQTGIDASVAAGAPPDLALRVGLLRPLLALSDVADLAHGAGWRVLPAARVYHQAGASFAFDRLRAGAAALLAGDFYQRQAARQMLEDLLGEQALLARAIMAQAERDKDIDSAEAAQAAVDAWIARRAEPVKAARDLVTEMEASGDGWSFPKLTIANSALRSLAGGAA